ncbi:phenylalanyl-tRNA synthetase subunit alpha [Photobacterium sp. S4TG1]|uniref:phenylalanyl-tRNA synthetase subunit alpha n=1 Tax=Photobacterium sp. S4TG1 TaxID=3114587 RepID=UPI002E19A92E|nr:phenylalanyl-tRNA synthetase subunit alpha [Photobacterium sp. S4TG1]
MNTQSFSALIKMSTFASLLCFGLVILGNYGMFSSMPIEMKDTLSNQTHIDYIHVIYYVGFNFIFVGFLAYLLIGLKHSQQQMKKYLAQH